MDGFLLKECKFLSQTAAKSARLVVAGAVSGLFGVAADLPQPDAAWKRDRQEHTDSDPVLGK